MPLTHTIDHAERTKLRAELRRIDRQKRAELAEHEHVLKKFRMKYGNRGVSTNEESGNENDSANSSNYHLLKHLLFTNNEVDVEKLICLYLLSMHQAESFRTPSPKILRTLTNETSPVERLIRRSKVVNKNKRSESPLLRALPVYVIDISQSSSAQSTTSDSEERTCKDPRLTCRLIINEGIEKILISILDALKTSRSEKFVNFVTGCQNVNYMKQIFDKSTIQHFLTLLKDSPFMTCCDSYYLSKKLKKQPVFLDVQTSYGSLENLVQHIRGHILNVDSNWRNKYNEVRPSSQTWRTEPENLTIQLRPRNENKFLRKEKEVVPFPTYEKETIDACTSCPCVENHPDKTFAQEDMSEIISYRTYDNQESAILSTRTEEQTANLEEKWLEAVSTTITKNGMIRKINCCACQEKWRTPLPHPKIDVTNKRRFPNDNKETVAQTIKVKKLIKEETKRLYNFMSRYSVDNCYVKITPPVIYSCLMKKQQSAAKQSEEILDEDLMKIQIEIANIETDEKLKEFLGRGKAN